MMEDFLYGYNTSLLADAHTASLMELQAANSYHCFRGEKRKSWTKVAVTQYLFV